MLLSVEHALVFGGFSVAAFAPSVLGAGISEG